MRSCVSALLAALLCACAKEREPEKPVEHPAAVSNARLSCERSDSLVEGALRYSDEIHGTANTAGGTRIALLPSSPAWRMAITPVASDFPDEPNMWTGDEEPETLTVAWHASTGTQGVVTPSALQLRRDKKRVKLDSISFAASCRSLLLVMWAARTPSDTQRLPRPPEFWP